MTTDIRKAAVVLMSLPQEQAADILAQLGPRQRDAVTRQIEASGPILAEELRRVAREFAEAEAARPRAGRWPFRFLQAVDSRALSNLLTDEHPQTIALVIANLPPAPASGAIAMLPAELQSDIVRRIALMEGVSGAIVRDVAQQLELQLADENARQPDPMGGPVLVAEILSHTERTTREKLLEALAAHEPELANTIRGLMPSETRRSMHIAPPHFGDGVRAQPRRSSPSTFTL